MKVAKLNLIQKILQMKLHKIHQKNKESQITQNYHINLH